MESLRSAGHQNCEFRLLDLSSTESIHQFVESIKIDYNNSIDILVNNGAVAFKADDPTPFQQQARPTLTTNYFGNYELTMKLLPLLRNAKNFGRLVNVASEAGHLRILKNPALKEKFANISELTIPTLNDLLSVFIRDVENGTHVENGWPSTCYGMSKLGLIALTKRLALEDESQDLPKHVLITCCCPGYCDTDMTSHKGTKSARDGAKTPVFLALTPAYSSSLNGNFFSNEKEIPW